MHTKTKLELAREIILAATPRLRETEDDCLTVQVNRKMWEAIGIASEELRKPATDDAQMEELRSFVQAAGKVVTKPSTTHDDTACTHKVVTPKYAYDMAQHAFTREQEMLAVKQRAAARAEVELAMAQVERDEAYDALTIASTAHYNAVEAPQQAQDSARMALKGRGLAEPMTVQAATEAVLEAAYNLLGISPVDEYAAVDVYATDVATVALAEALRAHRKSVRTRHLWEASYLKTP